MFALTHANRDCKTLLEAIACMDCAIWDLIGKALGRTARELLGGYRERLPVISIGGWLLHARQEARGFRREVESYRKAGMAGCKFKVGGLTPEEDAKRVAVRQHPQRASRLRYSCAPPPAPPAASA